MKRSLLALALLAAIPFSAQAQDADTGLSYTYAEADYVNADVSGLDSMDGFSVHGNAAFADHWYGTGSWSRVSEGTSGLDFDFEQFTLGAGFHTAMGSKADFLAEVAYISDDFEVALGGAGGGSNKERFDGIRATAGVRALFSPHFEGEIKAHYTNIDELDGGFGGEINAIFHIDETWGITAGYSTDDLGDDDVNAWKLGVRGSF
jgi:hypothetical protein